MDQGIWPFLISKRQLGAWLGQMASQSSKQGYHQQINPFVLHHKEEVCPVAKVEGE